MAGVGLRAGALSELIDGRPLSSLQLRVLILAAITIVLDGFDIQAVAFAAPALSAELGIERSRLGPVFSAGLLGMAIGSIAISPLSDRVGRRVCVLLSVAVFGGFTLLTAAAKDFETLLLLRFCAGLGFGGALPSIVVLVGEFSPARMRAICSGAVLVGVPVGGLLGGLFANWAIPAFGWQAIFVAGGVLPLVLLLVLFFQLPESPAYLATRGARGSAQLADVLRRLAPDRQVSEFTVPGAADARPERVGPRALFARGQMASTLLLWAAFFTNLMGIYFLFNWIPTLLVDAGYSVSLATTAAVVFNCGGVIGLIGLGVAVNRLNLSVRHVIAWALGIAAIHVALLGVVSERLELMFAALFVVGLCVQGAQGQLFGLGTALYSAQVRTTGLGWAVGFGRFGSVLGPLVGGALVMLELGTTVYFTFFGVLLGVGALAVLGIRRPELAAVLQPTREGIRT